MHAPWCAVVVLVAAAGCHRPSSDDVREVVQRSFADDNAYCVVPVVPGASADGGPDLFLAVANEASERACLDALVGLRAAQSIAKNARFPFAPQGGPAWSFRLGPNAKLAESEGPVKHLLVACGKRELTDIAPFSASGSSVEVTFTQSVRVDRDVTRRLPCGVPPRSGDEQHALVLQRARDGHWAPR